MNNISSVKTSLNRKVSPGNINQSKDIFGCLAEAGRNLLTNIKPKELSKRVIIENALYDQVFKFRCPDDLAQENVMQWYRLDGNKSVDTFYHPILLTTNRRFDQHRRVDGRLFTIEWDKGIRFIKVSDFGHDKVNAGLTIHTMDSLTENGTWNVFGNVTNLVTDNLTFVAGHGSLRFDINDSSNVGGIENFTLTPFNITNFLTVGKIFTWLDLPNVGQIQTLQLEMFSSPGNGYSITVNSPHDTSAFQLGQNMLGFVLDTNTMITMGAPNPAALNHIRFTFTTNALLLMNNVRMDNVVARSGHVFGIQYISKFLYKDVDGLFKENPTEDSDEVMLDFEAFQLYLEEAAIVLGQEIYTDKNQSRLAQMQAQLTADYRTYKKNYKEEFIDKTQVQFYFGVPFGSGNQGDGGDRYDHRGEMY